LKKSINQNELKLNIIDVDKNLLDFIVDMSKIRALLEQCDHKELCEKDLFEQEEFLLFLSSINVFVNFNVENKRINSIMISNIKKLK
jgi:hypothetical protein